MHSRATGTELCACHVAIHIQQVGASADGAEGAEHHAAVPRPGTMEERLAALEALVGTPLAMKPIDHENRLMELEVKLDRTATALQVGRVVVWV